MNCFGKKIKITSVFWGQSVRVLSHRKSGRVDVWLRNIHIATIDLRKVEAIRPEPKWIALVGAAPPPHPQGE